MKCSEHAHLTVLRMCVMFLPDFVGCLCQWELKAPTDRLRSDCVHEQALSAELQGWIANVRFIAKIR